MFSKIKLPFLVNRHRKLMFLMILLPVTVSCFRDPVNIDLTDYGPNIVIVGNIADHPGPHSVRISRTAIYNGQDDFRPVSGAIVTIEDNLGYSIPLQETESGLYQTAPVKGIPGRTYKLTVIVDGEKYSASSTMPRPLLLQSLNFERVESDRELYAFSCSFQDHREIEDYGLVNIYQDGNLNDHRLYNDYQSDGQEITLDNFDALFNKNNVITVDFLTLDKAAYDFFNTLDIIDDREDDEFVSSFIPLTTFNPTTNLDKGALGYFSAHTLRRYVLVVE